MTVWHINTKLNTQLEWKSLERKRAYLRRPRVHFGANISMKIGIPLQPYPLQRVKARNREVEIYENVELILSSGYHGVFSCTRDIRYPYRKKRSVSCAEHQVTYIYHGWIQGLSKGTPSPLVLGEILFCFVMNFY